MGSLYKGSYYLGYHIRVPYLETPSCSTGNRPLCIAFASVWPSLLPVPSVRQKSRTILRGITENYIGEEYAPRD